MKAHDDERTLHRLEAFSDIVMGFCLAEVAIGFAIPSDAAGLHAMWPSLTAFAFSFVLIAALWWDHHRLFKTYAVLNPPTIVMNFALLGMLALGVYFSNVTVHFVASGKSPGEPGQFYLACMAIVFVLMTAMYVIGIGLRRHELGGEVLRWGVDRAYRQLVAAIMLGAMCAVFPSMGRYAGLTFAILGLLAAALALRRLFVPRIVDALKRRTSS